MHVGGWEPDCPSHLVAVPYRAEIRWETPKVCAGIGYRPGFDESADGTAADERGSVRSIATRGCHRHNFNHLEPVGASDFCQHRRGSGPSTADGESRSVDDCAWVYEACDGLYELFRGLTLHISVEGPDQNMVYA